ncbi:MAG: hypothetical protein GYA50_10265, partial [Eubacteriaceae bacterium]|nr:hypothetical protein [Eubacteriaceae bacterium]
MKKYLRYIVPTGIFIASLIAISAYSYINLSQVLIFSCIPAAITIYFIAKKRKTTFFQYNTHKVDIYYSNEKTDASQIPSVTFDNIAGLDEIKEELY